MLEQRVVADLLSAIDRHELLLFVGTGATIAATGLNFSWRAAVASAVDAAEREERLEPRRAGELRRRLDSEFQADLLQVATEVAGSLEAPGGEPWARWLTDTFGNLESRTPAVITQAIAQLASLGVPLLTTNYDGLLTEGSRRECVTCESSSRALEVVRGDRRNATLHLHGHWSIPRSVVFGVQSYEAMIRDRFNQDLLVTIAAMQTVLFIGCDGGLEDPNVSRFFDFMRRNASSARYRHYRLVRADQLEQSRSQHKPGDRVDVVTYGDTFEDLPVAMDRLAKAAAERAAPLPPAQPARSNVFNPERCVGRSAVIKSACDLILSRERVLILLLGAIGIGKATVAQQIGGSETAIRRFGDRRWLISLDTASDAKAMTRDIAVAVGLDPSADPVDVKTRLDQDPSLIILKGIETPWEGPARQSVELLLSQLVQADNLSIIVTKRGVVPPEGARWQLSVELQPLGGDDAAALFRDVAGWPSESPVLDLDGVPQAIVLVARRGRGRSYVALERMWRKLGINMMKSDRGTLNASIEMALSSPSVQPETGRTLFALLGQLPAGISPEDLDALLGDRGFDAFDELRHAGLAHQRGDRLILLSAIRDYALRRHPPAREHLHWYRHYLDLVAHHGIQLGTRNGEVALTRLRPELPNIDAAIRAAVDAKAFSTTALGDESGHTRG